MLQPDHTVDGVCALQPKLVDVTPLHGGSPSTRGYPAVGRGRLEAAMVSPTATRHNWLLPVGHPRRPTIVTRALERSTSGSSRRAAVCRAKVLSVRSQDPRTEDFNPVGNQLTPSSALVGSLAWSERVGRAAALD